MSKHYYPAVFTKENDNYLVSFPDILAINTFGTTLEEAYEMALDALGLFLIDEKDKFVYPPAGSPSDIKVGSEQFVALIEFDELEYLKKHSRGSVKKTLSIPVWLNTAAEQKNVNFSQTLQEALKAKLNFG